MPNLASPEYMYSTTLIPTPQSPHQADQGVRAGPAVRDDVQGPQVAATADLHPASW